MKKYVIIGNGAAAVGCIEGIRSVDAQGSITVISKEPHVVYGRPLISYYLEGKTDAVRMQYRSEKELAALGCTVLYGKSAVTIEKDAQIVRLDDGTAIPYDALCVAAGSSPWNPPFAGLEQVENPFRFMTMDDALALEKAVTKESRVLIVGAGLIGLKCAEGLHGRAKSITVCDLAPRVLSSILDDACAAMVQTHLEANGIRFLLGDTVEAFTADTAKMKSGETVGFDILVLAVGVRANTALVKEIGGEINRGIVTNEKQQTSVPAIWAAGDCTEGVDSNGDHRVLALMPNAVMQGRCAGINMAGGEAVHTKAIPMNAIGFFGLHLMSAGTTDGEVYEEKTATTMKRLFTRDGLLVGMILIGDTTRGGIYTAMIREKTPLDTVNFELLRKLPTTAAYSAERRKTMFGSEV